MPYLDARIPTGDKKIRLRPKPLTIGRHPDNKFVIKDTELSRHHCVIEHRGHDFVVRDLGSSNGTLVNGSRIGEHRLVDGDVVEIGSCEFHFVDEENAKKSESDIPLSTPEQAELEDELSQPAGSQSPSPQKSRRPGSGLGSTSGSSRHVKRERLKAARRAERDTNGPQAAFDPDAFDPLDVTRAVAENTARTGFVEQTFEERLHEIAENGGRASFALNDIHLVDQRGTIVHGQGSMHHDSSDRYAALQAIRLLLYACFCAGATDLHLEPRAEGAVVRLRVDGFMTPPIELDGERRTRILNIIRVLIEASNMKPSAVVDGHFSARIGATESSPRVDFRVSLTPAMNGHKLVIRILDPGAAPTRLSQLGLVPWMHEKLQRIVTRDSGLLLACGPTGSGKTTSLYACMREIDIERRNVVTIEDPVEYALEGATQIPVDHDQGNSFGTILRSVMRQDPDVIFVGEIRDLETAQVAMQAAMTGHLVYSTVHSKDCFGAVFRLLDLGLEPYLVANALQLLISQRLVRRLCENCKSPVRPTPAQTMKMGHAMEGLSSVFVPTGCKRCLKSGYRGRRAIFELLEVSDEMRDIILDTPSIQGLRRAAASNHFVSLAQFGWQLVSQGVTSLDEIERVAVHEG